jgi:hypothetical protein
MDRVWCHPYVSYGYIRNAGSDLFPMTRYARSVSFRLKINDISLTTNFIHYVTDW